MVRFTEMLTGTSPAVDGTLLIHRWDMENRVGIKGWVYYDERTKRYFKLKAEGGYGYFPVHAEDNEWWQFVGTDS